MIVDNSNARLALMNDGEVATLLKVSKSCIRGQRFKRQHGLPHWLTVDPVYIGKCPRYRHADFQSWMGALRPASNDIDRRLEVRAIMVREARLTIAEPSRLESAS